MAEELRLPSAKGFFVTGTDTGIGKTLVGGGIAKILRDAGKRVGVFKPVATGCQYHDEGLVNEDPEFLRRHSGSEHRLDTICPVGYVLPAAPCVSAEHENRPVDFQAMAKAYEKVVAESDAVIVEGAGGIRVPVDAGVDMLGLAKWFGLPVVIVARPDLGTINHTLLTVDCIRGAGLEVAGVVISGYDAFDSSIAEEQAAVVIEEWGDVPVLSVVPKDEDSDVASGKLGELTVEALGDADWAGMLG
ncbi:ATP-dependent dethiobiotin synthetase BioD 1 [Anaerohalosphaera lusitana]|uniref:ATP-dependent dethiobiotin synthetase BioD n=1 Tax=Anaerohalosphaera lusitana TaxID=1936003 RepID=A0A1U9NGU3_9BACT|nr:dethiobiotin synthase [Anaerohalosphaera lusitana]AQT67153.1 ATP-dependent dethiobiotin synthetase BioD 1 [Anaerohalosphaera lusitana]